MTDKELAYEVAFHGNQKAFAEIVRRYSGVVFSKALGIMHSEEGAAEITQQTFIRAYESLSDWRGVELRPWLSVIAVHTALKHLEKERRRRTSSMEEMPSLAINDSDSDASFSAEHEAKLQQMEEAISQLSATDQQILKLHYYDRIPTADISRTTGLTQSNVLVKLHRIRERLKNMINNENND